MFEFLKKIISKAGVWIFGALGISAVFQNIGTTVLTIVIIVVILYAIKVFRK